MSNILFADFGRAVSQAENVLNSRAQRNAFAEEKAREQADAPHVTAALKGDRTAIERVSPGTALKLAPLFERMDAAQRAKAKDAAEFTASAANAVLQADPAERGAIYAQILADGKSRGFDLSRLPQQYTPQMDGQLRTYRSMAIPMLEHFKQSEGGVQFAPPVGGGPAPAGGGVNPNNIGNVRPVGGGPSAGFQQPATFEDGVKLAVNNVKAYPAKFNGGQPMTLLQIGERWAPKGDGANDPRQWAINVGSIGGLDPNKPLDLNDPATAAAFARGVHGAEHGAGKAQPVEAYARILTGGAPQGMPQGDGGPPGSPAGAGPQETPPALAPLRGLQLPPGARVALQKGVPIVKDGAVLYIDANGGWGAAPLPQRAEPKAPQAPAGYEFAPGGGLAPIPGGPADPARQRNERVPQGYRLAPDGTSLEFIPGGPADPAVAKKVGPMTEGQANAALYADRMRNSEKIIAATEKAGLNFGEKAKSSVPGVGNFMVSEDYQKFDQARRDFINAVLRRESGAVISAEEFENGNKQYFPQPGDGPEVLKQKVENRRIAIEGISRAAGSSYKPDAAPAAPAAPAQPQAPAIAEGATATNPQTGAKIIFRGGQWVPQ